MILQIGIVVPEPRHRIESWIIRLIKRNGTCLGLNPPPRLCVSGLTTSLSRSFEKLNRYIITIDYLNNIYKILLYFESQNARYNMLPRMLSII